MEPSAHKFVASLELSCRTERALDVAQSVWAGFAQVFAHAAIVAGEVVAVALEVERLLLEDL